MLIHLLFSEVRRHLHIGRVAALAGLGAALSLNDVQVACDPGQGQFQGALTWHRSWLTWVILVVSGIMGSSLAHDRRLGITLTVLANGVSRGRYLLVKALAAGVSGAAATLPAIMAFYVVVAIRWPMGRVTWPPTERLPGPVPDFYSREPLLHDLLLAAMSMVASAGLSLTGLLAGTLLANRYVAMAVPLVFFLVGAMGQSTSVAVLNPLTYVEVSGTYTSVIPPAWRPYAAFVYWAAFGALLFSLSRWILSRRELC